MSEEVYMRGVLNIIDPIKNRKNITRSVDLVGFREIQLALQSKYHNTSQSS